MKVVAAYLLAVLGGNPKPSADDLKNILNSGILSFLCFFISFSPRFNDFILIDSNVFFMVILCHCMIWVIFI